MKSLLVLFAAVILLMPFPAFPDEIRTLPRYQDLNPVFRYPVVTPSTEWAGLQPGTTKLELSPEFTSEKGSDRIGIGMSPGKLNFSAFYEMLKTENSLDVLPVSLSTEQYAGSRYGVKLGFGTQRNFISLSYAGGHGDHAYDMTGLSPAPEFREAIGMEFKLSFGEIASLTGSLELNGSDREIAVENEQKAMNDQQKRWHKIFSTYRSGRAPEWAVESAFSLDLKNFRSLVTYRNVKLDLQSPGASFAFESGRSFSFNNTYKISQKLRISTSLVYRNKDEIPGLSGKSKSLNAEINMHYDRSGHFMFDLHAMTNKTAQAAGSFETTFSTTSGQRSDELSFSPAYRLLAGKDEKIVSGNLAVGSSDVVLLYEDRSVKNKNLAASLEYNQYPSKKEPGFSIRASYNRSGKPDNYSSTIGIAASAASRVKNAKKLQVNGNVNICYSKHDRLNTRGDVNISGGITCRRGMHEITSILNFNVTRNDAWTDPAIHIPGKVSPLDLPVGISYAIRF